MYTTPPFIQPAHLPYADKSWRWVENKFLDIYVARSATAMADMWTRKDITYSLIFSEASHLKPPTGAQLPREESEAEPQHEAETSIFVKSGRQRSLGGVQLLPALCGRAGFGSRALPTSAPRLLFGWHGHSSARAAALFVLLGRSDQHANRCGALHANALAHKARCHQPHHKKNTDFEI